MIEQHAGAAVADAVEQSKGLLTRYLAGLGDEHIVLQSPGLPNHLAWQLGHLALTMHRCCELGGGGGLPEADFITGDGHSGSATRYDTQSVCYGSTPAPEPRLYPGLARARTIYEAACDRLAAQARAASREQLERGVPWGGGEHPWRQVAMRMVFHNGMHTGEIVDLRRALGLPKVVG